MRRYIVIPIFLVIAVMCIEWFSKSHLLYYKFDSELWATSDSMKRFHMAKYLHDNESLAGKSMAQVQNLLGQPDQQASQFQSYRVEERFLIFFPIGTPYRLDLIYDSPKTDAKLVKSKLVPD